MNYETREPIVLINDNQKIFGVIHRPLQPRETPAIVMCHGLAGNKIGRYRSYVHSASELAKKGFTVLRFDFRGSGDSEGESHDMTVTSAVNDTLAALNFLQEDPRIDSQRIGLFGRSFGGAVALLAASKFPDSKSIALWAPIFHAKEWEEKWNDVQTLNLPLEEIEELKRINGQLLGNGFWSELFAMDIAKALGHLKEKPLLHIHGEKDTIVPLHHAKHYREVRKEAPALTQFLLLSTADHDFTSAKNQKIAIEETVAWFEKTL